MTKTPQEEEDEMTDTLLKAAGFEEVPGPLRKTCHTCISGWEDDRGIMHCGSSCNAEPLAYWAKLKYSVVGMLAELAGTPFANTDCENIDPAIADKCEAYNDGKESRKPTTTEHQERPEA